MFRNNLKNKINKFEETKFRIMYILVIHLHFKAICDGKIRDKACHRRYYGDEIRRQDGSRESFSGGSCHRHNLCHSCNDGFYVDEPCCRSKHLR